MAVAGLVRIAIVGLGHIAPHHIAAIERSDRFRLVAVCDSNPTRLAMISPPVETYASLDEMLSSADADAVIVASPNRLHVEHGVKVMAAGKWLVMEKPLAESAADFEYFCRKRRELSGSCSLALHAAHAVDVEWLLNAPQGTLPHGSPMRAVKAGFYDPYFENGTLQERAESLGGSWLDSGINALSVICQFIPLDELTIQDSRMTRVAGVRCSEVQGTVDFSFGAGEAAGAGTIDTNWTLGRNQKHTVLAWDDRRIVMDHSAQTVTLQQGGQTKTLFSCENRLPRLTNHYVGVFADLARQMTAGLDNFDHCRRLHELLFAAHAWSGPDKRL